MRKHLPNVDLRFERLAVTEFLIQLLGLPTKPRKATDRRRPDITETVEAEAIPAYMAPWDGSDRHRGPYSRLDDWNNINEIDRHEQAGLKRLGEPYRQAGHLDLPSDSRKGFYCYRNNKGARRRNLKSLSGLAQPSRNVT